MSILLDNLSAKASMFAWLRDTAERFIMPFITLPQRMALQRHVERMEAFQGNYEVKCEIAQDAKGEAMKLTITIYPGRAS